MNSAFMKLSAVILLASLFALGSLQGGKDSPLSIEAKQTYQFEIPVRSEVVPLRSLTIQNKLSSDEIDSIESAVEGDEVDYVPEALVVLDAKGFSDTDQDGKIEFELVDQTGDSIDRRIELSADAIREQRLKKTYAEIKHYRVEAQFKGIEQPVNLWLWLYSYTDYAVERSKAHGEAGLTNEAGQTLDYSDRFEVFGFSTTEIDGEQTLFPVSGRLLGERLELSTQPRWSGFLEGAEALKAMANWDRSNVTPKFEAWKQAARAGSETDELLTGRVQEIVELKKNPERSRFSEVVRTQMPPENRITIKGTLPSGKSVEWQVDLNSSGTEIGDLELKPKLRSYSNSANDDEPRAHFMHWIELPNMKAVAGLFSEYMKDRSNRSFACQGAPVGETHESLVGAGLSSEQYAFMKPAYFEGALDMVKMLSLDKLPGEGFHFDIIYWYIFRDSTHGKSFIDLDRKLSSSTDFQ